METTNKLINDGWIVIADGYITKYNDDIRLEYRQDTWLDILQNNSIYVDLIRIKNPSYEKIKEIEKALLYGN